MIILMIPNDLFFLLLVKVGLEPVLTYYELDSLILRYNM